MYQKIRIYIFIIGILACSAMYAAAPIEVPGAAIGVYIAPVDGDAAPVVEYNSDICFTPASVMKAVTSATALAMLGPDFRWETSVAVTGGVESGILTGDIVINGSGDPTLESRFFADNRGFCDRLANALASAGCRSVAGRIVAAQDWFADSGVNPAWEVEDIAWDYGAGLYGVNFRDNSFMLMLPEGKIEPPVPGLCIVDRTVVGTGELSLLRGVDSETLIAGGRCRAKGVRVWCSMPDPSSVLCHELDSTLHSRGIGIDGCVIESAGDRNDIIMQHFSPTLSEVLRSLMVRSDNLMAEGVLRALSPGSTRSEVIARMRAYWKANGIDLGYTRILDGSGLARGNALSPHQLGDILRWMARSTHAEEYVALFPRAGVDGTMRSFMAKSRLRRHYALKTGSMGGVQCYAGYRLDASGKQPTHVVVVMVNNFTGSRTSLRREVERLLSETRF